MPNAFRCISMHPLRSEPRPSWCGAGGAGASQVGQAGIPFGAQPHTSPAWRCHAEAEACWCWKLGSGFYRPMTLQTRCQTPAMSKNRQWLCVLCLPWFWTRLSLSVESTQHQEEHLCLVPSREQEKHAPVLRGGQAGIPSGAQPQASLAWRCHAEAEACQCYTLSLGFYRPMTPQTRCQTPAMRRGLSVTMSSVPGNH